MSSGDTSEGRTAANNAKLQPKYDHLVIALGNITNFYGMPGMIENAMPFRTLADARTLRNHLIHVLDEADVEENQELRRQLLTFIGTGTRQRRRL